MPVSHLSSDAEYNREVLQSRGKLVIVDFFATWCGPCKAIEGPIENLSRTYADAKFVKVDVDKLQQSAQNAQVRAMPTIQAFRDGRMIDEVVGADMAKIEAMVRKHYTPTTFSGSGLSLGGGSAAAAAAASNKLFESLSAGTAAAPVEQCEIQFKLSNGQTIRGTFKGDDTVATVKAWVVGNRTDGSGDRFNLMTTFPRRVYEGALLQRTLNEEGLTKRAQLVLSPY